MTQRLGLPIIITSILFTVVTTYFGSYVHSLFHTSLSGSHKLAVVDGGFPFWQRTADEYRFFFDLRLVLPRNNTLRLSVTNRGPLFLLAF